MKRLLIITAILLSTFILYGQAPYKIGNPWLNQVWRGDTAKTYIFTDSTVLMGTNPLHISYSTIRLTKVPHLGDTNVLAIDATGKIFSTPIGGGGGSKWTLSGANLYPNSTATNVAIGATNANGFRFYETGRSFMTFTSGDIINDSITNGYGTFPFVGVKDSNTLCGIINFLPLPVASGWWAGYAADFATDRNTVNTTENTVNVYSIKSAGDSAFAGIHSMQGVYETDLHLDTKYGTSWGFKKFTSFGGAIKYNRLWWVDSTGTYFNVKLAGVSPSTAFRIDSLKKITFNEAYTFPLADGSANQVLTTDGSGVVTWEDGGGGGIPADSVPFRRSGNTIFPKSSAALLMAGTTGATPTSGAGTRMMYIPDKEGAFRSGIVGGTQWDAGSIGNGSVAFGLSGTASGAYSTFTGYSGFSSGNYSACIGGYSNTSSGLGSLVIGGWQNVANIDAASVVGGYQNHAYGAYSFCTGMVSEALGTGSFAANNNTYASSYNMTAFGRYNVGGGTAGSWVATDQLFVIGNGTGTGASANNAFTVLKNGTTYIGDATPTRPPVMTVNTADSLVTLTGDLTYKLVHYYANSEDTTYTPNITQNVWTKIQPYYVRENKGFTQTGDSITFTKAGSYKVTATFTFSGANGDDFKIALFFKGVKHYSIRRTTSGGANYAGGTLSYYIDGAAVNDVMSIRCTNITNSNDPTFVGASLYIRKEY